MEKKRIKSAWEIALERAERLGDLSRDELRAREEAQHDQIGQALASRHLSGLPLRELLFAIGKHEDSARKNIQKAVAAALADALDLDNPDSAEMARVALQALLPELHLGEQTERARKVIADYHGAKREAQADHRDTVHQKIVHHLRRRGIAGSAVRPNLNATQEWQELVNQTRSEFADRLLHLKIELRSRVLEA
ncbi:MAG: hypothetical protein M1358_07960 [Chloroflexi bacterium]|nr:hypothetical protein [Chloroflexota bacterium]